MNPNSPDSSAADGGNTDWLAVVRRNAAALRFGSIQITVHDGRVTQVESIEKTRFVTIREEPLTTRR